MYLDQRLPSEHYMGISKQYLEVKVPSKLGTFKFMPAASILLFTPS